MRDFPKPSAPTRFDSMPDDLLLARLHRGSPQVPRDIARGWDDIRILLETSAEEMASGHRTTTLPYWTGRAASDYQVAIDKLVAATRRMAEMATVVRNVMHHSADSLELAQRMFPPGSTGGPGPTPGGQPPPHLPPPAVRG